MDSCYAIRIFAYKVFRFCFVKSKISTSNQVSPLHISQTKNISPDRQSYFPPAVTSLAVYARGTSNTTQIFFILDPFTVNLDTRISDRPSKPPDPHGPGSSVGPFHTRLDHGRTWGCLYLRRSPIPATRRSFQESLHSRLNPYTAGLCRPKQWSN